MTGNEVSAGEHVHVCHYFQEKLCVYPWTTRKISYVHCLCILLPELWQLYAKAGYAQRSCDAICEWELYVASHCSVIVLVSPSKTKEI